MEHVKFGEGASVKSPTSCSPVQGVSIWRSGWDELARGSLHARMDTHLPGVGGKWPQTRACADCPLRAFTNGGRHATRSPNEHSYLLSSEHSAADSPTRRPRCRVQCSGRLLLSEDRRFLSDAISIATQSNEILPQTVRGMSSIIHAEGVRGC